MTRHGNRKGARRSKEAARLPDSKEEEKEEEEEAKQQRSRLYIRKGTREGIGHCSRKCRQLGSLLPASESIAYIAFGDPEVTESFRDYLNGWIDRSILWLSRKGYCLAVCAPSFPPSPPPPLRHTTTHRAIRFPPRERERERERESAAATLRDLGKPSSPPRKKCVCVCGAYVRQEMGMLRSIFLPCWG